MTTVYRTAGAWGAGKGALLTASEIDNNFWNIIQRIIEVEDNPPEANSITNITVVGSQFTVWMGDGSSHGPFTLPTAVFHFRGAWEPDTQYFALDLVRVPSEGLFMVMHSHVSDTTFSENAFDTRGLFYTILLPAESDILGLNDTPDSYIDQGGKVLQVNSGETGIEFVLSPYDIGGHFHGKTEEGGTAGNQLIFRFLAPRAVTLPNNLAGSRAYAAVVSSAQTDFDVQVNGVSVATMRFETGTATATFSSPATPPALAAGDRLDIVAPASPDATLADISWTIVGTR